jgi:hypothetical protein
VNLEKQLVGALLQIQGDSLRLERAHAAVHFFAVEPDFHIFVGSYLERSLRITG